MCQKQIKKQKQTENAKNEKQTRTVKAIASHVYLILKSVLQRLWIFVEYKQYWGVCGRRIEPSRVENFTSEMKNKPNARNNFRFELTHLSFGYVVMVFNRKLAFIWQDRLWFRWIAFSYYRRLPLPQKENTDCSTASVVLSEMSNEIIQLNTGSNCYFAKIHCRGQDRLKRGRFDG